MTKPELIKLISEAKQEHSTLVLMRKYYQADQLKGKIRKLIKKLR